MAGAHHDAALREQRGSAEAVLVGAQQRSDEHVATGLEATVDLQPHTGAQAVGDQGLLRLGQAELPRQAGVLDARQR